MTKATQTAVTGQSGASVKKNPPAQDRTGMVKRWQLARQYYMTGRVEAEGAYLALIEQYPDNPELPGELGNIYYNAGKFSEAAKHYYNAALLHLRGSRPEIAGCILKILERIDTGKAADLRDKVTRSCPSQRG